MHISNIYIIYIIYIYIILMHISNISQCHRVILSIPVSCYVVDCSSLIPPLIIIVLVAD